MSAPIISIDLHGMFQDEAIKVIDKTLKNGDTTILLMTEYSE